MKIKKDTKHYALVYKENDIPSGCIYKTLEEAKKAMDNSYYTIAECTITKIFTVNPVIIEI